MSYFHCDNAGAWHQYTTQQCAAIESARSSGKAVVLPGTADMMEVRFDEEAVTSQGNLAFTKMIQVSGLSFHVVFGRIQLCSRYSYSCRRQHRHYDYRPPFCKHAQAPTRSSCHQLIATGTKNLTAMLADSFVRLTETSAGRCQKRSTRCQHPTVGTPTGSNPTEKSWTTRRTRFLRVSWPLGRMPMLYACMYGYTELLGLEACGGDGCVCIGRITNFSKKVETIDGNREVAVKVI